MTGLRMPNLTQRHDCEASKLSKARIDLFILGADNLDAKRQGKPFMYAGEMVGKMGNNERDDDENDSDDENDKAKRKACKVNLL